MGRGSPVCQQIRERNYWMFKKQCSSKKDRKRFGYFTFNSAYIIKDQGIWRNSVRKGQGRKPKWQPWSPIPQRHCIKNRHSSISDITTWAQDYFGKPLSSTTIRSYIHKCQLKLYCAKRKPYVNSVQKAPSTSLGSEASGMDHHTVETCTVVRWISISGIFWEEWTPCAPDQRRKGSSRLLPATSPKARGLSWYGVVSCPWQR